MTCSTHTHTHTHTCAGQNWACHSSSHLKPSHYCVYCLKGTPKIDLGTVLRALTTSKHTHFSRVLTGTVCIKEKFFLLSNLLVAVLMMPSTLTLSSPQGHLEVSTYSRAVKLVHSLDSFLVTNVAPFNFPVSSVCMMCLHGQPLVSPLS